jgi:hypothetical protein
MRLAVLFVALSAGPALLAQEKGKDKDKPAVKEIATKDLKVTFPKAGKATEPTEVKTAEELAKNPVVGASAEEINKHIDFEKQKLVVFAWGGSGGDRVTASVGAGSDGKPLVFAEYLRGKTRDLRQHVKLYAVPKDLKVVVELGR